LILRDAEMKIVRYQSSFQNVSQHDTYPQSDQHECRFVHQLMVYLFSDRCVICCDHSFIDLCQISSRFLQKIRFNIVFEHRFLTGA
jgi:hypothetical protein